MLLRKPGRSTECSLTSPRRFLTCQQQRVSEPLDCVSPARETERLRQERLSRAEQELPLFPCNQKQACLLLHTKPVEAGW